MNAIVGDNGIIKRAKEETNNAWVKKGARWNKEYGYRIWYCK